MYAFAIVSFLAVAFSTGFFSAAKVTTNTELQQARAAAVAHNMAVYHEAALRYARENPTASGTLPESGLRLPAGYTKFQSWTATRNALTGQLVVSSQMTANSGLVPRNIARHVAELRDMPVTAGVSTGGGLTGPNGVISTADIPTLSGGRESVVILTIQR